MKILDHKKIRQKVKRLAIEILEHNYEEEELIIIGINNRGMQVALLLIEELKQLKPLPITLTRIRLSPADPLGSPIELEMPVEELNQKTILLVDDVANTGRTMFYACKPLMTILPKKIETAVLVDRQHKSFPIKVDYVGLSLATTLKENIDVEIQEAGEFAVFMN
ncbi:phosphoribosyltransferase family protein [Flavilitoribacter nigricans]|uniref:Phosphoribosyltransferase n=1 Tax=Flavilitoribacter nigricans (strain ATCC 23147 / DSM 23189 / NBRC 102662 / NCIMB 1420 / SS-2) TaxID=1122177 RepID=A0A2D0NEH5_FLAN2|nr:phosphoribosyltransferase family protein [Flavilitoribacter nigricans]PHN06183.1 phosphoribosyltransferase [Flavilitoribacter nigricans DSM 23189 = NBRC 102662]